MTEPLTIRGQAIAVNIQLDLLADEHDLTLQTINVGTYDNDGTGDLLHIALKKIESNIAIIRQRWGV